MRIHEAQAVVDAYFAALVGREDIAPYFSDDVVFELVDVGQRVEGRDEVVDAIVELHQQTFDAHPEVTNLVIGEGTAAAELVFVGTQTGEFAGIPASGKQVAVPYAAFYDLADAKITTLRIYGFASGLPWRPSPRKLPGIYNRAVAAATPAQQRSDSSSPKHRYRISEPGVLNPRCAGARFTIPAHCWPTTSDSLLRMQLVASTERVPGLGDESLHDLGGGTMSWTSCGGLAGERQEVVAVARPARRRASCGPTSAGIDAVRVGLELLDRAACAGPAVRSAFRAGGA